jgi:signal transduction histidine kinase/ActR/RegA family two-component response regulator
LSALHRQLSDHLGLEVYSCYLVETPAKDAQGDSDGEPYLRLESYGGISDSEAGRHARLEFGEGIPGTVAQLRDELIVRDAEAEAVGLRVFVCYPMLADGRLIGTLGFGTRTRANLEDDEIDVIHLVGDQSAMALERARLVDELQRRADALAEADRRKDEFLAMLAHELRNPLVPIMTGLKTFQLIETSTPKLQRARDAMERQVRHMVRLVDDLLDVSRVTAGKIELRKDLVDVAAIIQQAVQTSQPQFQEKNHSLTLSLPREPLELLVDPARLAQIVSNLLSNAAKYTDVGGAISLRACSLGDFVEIRVQDNGRGIRPEMLPQVFGLFVQSDRTLDMAQGGLGVGLTLVKRLVELHGGSVAARSEGEGTGSEFIVRLPAPRRFQAGPRGGNTPIPALRTGSTPTAAAAPRPAPRPAPPITKATATDPGLRHLKILVVDDNPDIRSTLHDLLEMLGHAVEVAEDGPEALARVRELRPDVALVDIGMPGMDGCEVARLLRNDPAYVEVARKLRLIAMTGYGQAEDRKRALDAGFDAHVVKPVDVDALRGILERISSN